MAERMKVCVVTGTRAEYGLLKPVIERLSSQVGCELLLAVTGAHLSKDHGYTVDEIIADGYEITVKIPILFSSVSSTDISISISDGLKGFAKFFQEAVPDILLLLGDRYELMAPALAAVTRRMPIVHIHGGETTEGALDEVIRHSLTKMSYLHFTSTEVYRQRVIQMGESPERVFNVGALGVENIKAMPMMDEVALASSLPFDLSRPFILVTYHPETMNDDPCTEQLEKLLAACELYDGYHFIFTGANADEGGLEINEKLKTYCAQKENAHFVMTLGVQRYLSLLRMAELVLGNSSSGIIEAPTFGIPTVNVGDRQKGRVQSETVINCRLETEDIKKAMTKALNRVFINTCRTYPNPYEGNETSRRIVDTLMQWFYGETIIPTKRFYDLEVVG